MQDKAVAMVGRFQPFHLGHLALAQFLAGEYKRLVIVIGSANRNYALDNPFTYEERVAMVHGSLTDAGVAHSILPSVDVLDNREWARGILEVGKAAGGIDVVACGKSLRPLFRDLGVECIATPKFKRDDYRGTAIRSFMLGSAVPGAAQNPWLVLVPAATARVISECHGAERLLALTEVD